MGSLCIPILEIATQCHFDSYVLFVGDFRTILQWCDCVEFLGGLLTFVGPLFPPPFSPPYGIVNSERELTNTVLNHKNMR